MSLPDLPVDLPAHLPEDLPGFAGLALAVVLVHARNQELCSTALNAASCYCDLDLTFRRNISQLLRELRFEFCHRADNAH